MTLTPDAALRVLATVRENVETLLETEQPDEIRAAFATLKASLDKLDLATVGDAGGTQAWQKVADALGELAAWLQEPAGEAGKSMKAMTRDEKIRLAVGIATRGRGASRGRDAADMILDGFYGGLGAILKGAWGALKLSVRGLVAAGGLMGRAVHAGAVHVDEYMRDGQRVHAHDRDAPSKSAPGAHLLYR